MLRTELCRGFARRNAVLAIVLAASVMASVITSSVRAQVPDAVAAPSFDLARLLGGSMESDDLKGNVVVVDFIATWCPPCIEEVPAYNALSEKYKGKNVRVIGIVVESGSLDEVKAKLAQLDIRYPVLFGAEKTISDFGIYAFPATLVLSKDWKIQHRHTEVAPNKKQSIEQEIDELLLASSSQQN